MESETLNQSKHRPGVFIWAKSFPLPLKALLNPKVGKGSGVGEEHQRCGSPASSRVNACPIHPSPGCLPALLPRAAAADKAATTKVRPPLKIRLKPPHLCPGQHGRVDGDCGLVNKEWEMNANPTFLYASVFLLPLVSPFQSHMVFSASFHVTSLAYSLNTFLLSLHGYSSCSLTFTDMKLMLTIAIRHS